jgi:hypothetical protein
VRSGGEQLSKNGQLMKIEPSTGADRALFLRARRAVRRRLKRWAFDRRAWALNRRRIIALGDSHIEVIDRYVSTRVKALFDVVSIPGATAQGLVNPNSSTDSLRVFETRLARAHRWQTILLELGEVDCGFVIWYRAEKKGVTIEEQVEVSLGNYLRFIDRQVARGFEVWVMSAPLPTIGDTQDWGEVANLRREVAASQVERTALTMRYNSRLEQYCLERRVRFIDVSSEQFDGTTGIIKAQFLHTNRLDHHLDDRAWGDAIVRELGLPTTHSEPVQAIVARRPSGRSGGSPLSTL